MKIKTAELTGVKLNWAVAKCENTLWLAYDNALNNEKPIPARPSEYLRDWEFSPDHFQPSADWAQGGPIIDREKIATKFWQSEKEWLADVKGGFFEQRGPTPLIAAMRCYVASKFGEEVDVPKELLS